MCHWKFEIGANLILISGAQKNCFAVVPPATRESRVVPPQLGRVVISPFVEVAVFSSWYRFWQTPPRLVVEVRFQFVVSLLADAATFGCGVVEQYSYFFVGLVGESNLGDDLL